MFTNAELNEFGTWMRANLGAGIHRSATVQFLERCRELLTDTRKEMAHASANGQIQRSLPPTRPTLTAETMADVDALLVAMTSLSSAPSQTLLDFGAWALLRLPLGPRRTQLGRLINEAGILEDLSRRQFIAASVNGQQQRATPPTRAAMVREAIDDANALLAAFRGLEDEGGK